MKSKISPNLFLGSSPTGFGAASIFPSGHSEEVGMSRQENSFNYPVIVRIAETLTKVGLRDRAERMAQTVTDDKAKAWVLMSIAKTLAEQG